VRKGFDHDHSEGGGNHSHLTQGFNAFKIASSSSSRSYGAVQPTSNGVDRSTPVESPEASPLHSPTASLAEPEQMLVERDTANLVASEIIPGNRATERHARLIVRAWIFFMALSVHGIFDGLSVGSEREAAGFTGTVIAVLSHKLFDGLALGCALFPAGLPVMQRNILILISGASTPVGIVAGMAADAAVDDRGVLLVNGIALGLASGSFLFISVMELLPSALADGRHVLLKLGAFGLGCGVMAALAVAV
jgi:zinc transporter ZupT